jgi:hypothetical protein
MQELGARGVKGRTLLDGGRTIVLEEKNLCAEKIMKKDNQIRA